MEILDIQTELGDVVRTCYNVEKINRCANEKVKDLIKVSEKIVDDQIERVVDAIIEGKYKFVFMAGPSSSGKTTTTRILSKKLKERGVNNITASLDDFFSDADKADRLPDGSIDKENITRIDLPFFNKFFVDIITKNSALMPEFDFKTSKRKEEIKTLTINDGDVILVEGTHALNPKLLTTHKYDKKVLKVFTCVNSEFRIGSNIVLKSRKLRLIRRMIRDLQTRNQSIRQTIESWDEVCKGEDIYITPYKKDADYLIDTTHLYEPLVFEKFLPALLNPVKDLPYAQELLKIADYCGTIDKKLVPASSLLWEFLVNKD